MGVVSAIVFFLRVLLGHRAAIAAENLALRHQLGVLHRSVKRLGGLPTGASNRSTP